MENAKTKIELRSEEFQEIVQQSPRWMIRSGISLVFGFLILLLAGSYFFRYPDVIKTNIVISAQNSIVQNDTLVKSGQQIPSMEQIQIIGKVNLPAKEVRKVAVGQKVNIRLEDYPSQEYGFIKGRIIHIASAPENGNYLIEVEMQKNLTTSYDIPIKFSQEMKGSAEIITEDLRLIQRFINPVKSLLNRRNSHSE
ncbi:MAG: HlyD family efflux transporter periplasmic adaptor subunit [Bacteroidia bacterium]